MHNDTKELLDGLSEVFDELKEKIIMLDDLYEKEKEKTNELIEKNIILQKKVEVAKLLKQQLDEFLDGDMV